LIKWRKIIRSDNILYSLLPTFFVDYSVLDGQHDVESVVCALCKDEKIYEHRLDHENIGADFRFEVPGQSSVGLIGGGRGQWLGGHHGECRARAYNGGVGAEAP